MATTTSPVSQAHAFTAEELATRTVERRAVEAAIWGMPIVSADAMRQAFFRDAGARYGDIVYWSRPADWRMQITTPNASTRYVYFNFNTKEGPVVLEIPKAERAGLFGSILSAWQVPLADVGTQGLDQGAGASYLLVPPGYEEAIAPEYVPVHLDTFNGYALFRVIATTSEPDDVAESIRLVKQMHVYPLADAPRPTKQRFIDMAGKLFDSAVHFDESFYSHLARMIGEEPVLEHDMVAMGQLRSLGIGKGLAFSPDHAREELLTRAAAEAHALFVRDMGQGEHWWPDRQWLVSAAVGPKTSFTFLTSDRLELDERGMLYFMACAPPVKLGAASVYLGGFRDAGGQPLRGERLYCLRVPPNVPAKQYWAATVYDMDTACFIRESPSVSVDSYGDLEKNPDGSVDVYFGSAAPRGKEHNWVYTAPGRPWFAFFRLYGPDKALFDKTWALTDIEPLHGTP